MLQANGGIFSKLEDWQPYAVEDGLLITGQNPASSELVAEMLLKKIKLIYSNKTLYYKYFIIKGFNLVVLIFISVQ
jgi:hypothetical protein